MAKEFTYDLERMMEAVDSKTYRLPDHIKTAEEFREWIRTINLETDDNGNESSTGDS